ncbi:EamA family transporter RarD [uncultured Shimia sp.]|uniref:EamA family transporter RarD n=1 Tax=uncultured Shimia sp. TaxID=573152 RepID=UPI0026372F7A|nr:EamA family transporter RarD [uncultured Shimia sp.]
MSDAGKGILAMVIACTIWGLGPLYWVRLSHIPAIDVIAHRTFWSAVTFLVLLLLQGRLGALRAALSSRRNLLIIMTAALMISLNWLIFIWAVGHEHATEASLGYFLFPLVAVVAGRVIYSERLAQLQWMAVALAAAAVVLLTYGLGVAPWIALVLACSFGAYGVIKKALDLGPVVSVTAEVVMLVPIALILLGMASHPSTRLSGPLQDTVLLVFSGAFTATPLILFSYAARRASLSTVGLVQYLNPTLQFFCAVVIFAEPFGLWHALSFPLIWAALALYSWSAWRQEKARVRAASNASISSTT